MKTYQIIVTLLVSLSFAMTAAWADTEGKCGDNVFWKFCTADSTLTLFGTGATYDYGQTSPWPNNSYSVNDPAHPYINWSDSIMNIIVADNITRIGTNLFYSLIHLRKVSLPSSIKSIGDDAFINCSDLAEVELPCQLEMIGTGAFNQCNSLKNVSFPSSLKTIGLSAFSETGLSDILLPASLEEIGEFAFLNCSNLTRIVVEEGNAKYDSREDCNAIIETATNTLLVGSLNSTIPSSVVNIGYGAFSSRKIVSVKIPSSVETIDKYAFFECSSLRSIYVPESVKDIGMNAFSGCPSLEYFQVEWTTPPTLVRNVFYRTPLKTLVVPEGCVEAYKNADGWKDFEQIVTATDIKEGALINDDSAKEIYRLDGTKVSGGQESLVPGTYIVQGGKILIK